MVSKVPELQKDKPARATNEVKDELTREYRYASHHHLIPLYILSGISIVALLVISCFLVVLWQSSLRESFRPVAGNTVQIVENQYIPAVVQPVEKKQYIYSANVRFPVTDPYNTIRYAYDPGITQTKTSAMLTITTSPTLQTLEAPILQNPDHTSNLEARLQECARLYVIRFEPGLVSYGNFAPLKEIPLKDGRTAYIHKNTGCVPSSVQAMDRLDKVEHDLLGIESY